MAVTERDVFSSLESVVMQGDLSKLSPHDRVLYYKKVCESLGLNPLTKPFDYLTLNGKMMLYARKDATEQLRALHGISIHISARELVDDVYVVTAQATNNNGRKDESIGAVNVGGLKGDAKANAIMKAETKAKRRVTLSICGLGMLDETEISTIPSVKTEEINLETGEIISSQKVEDKSLLVTKLKNLLIAAKVSREEFTELLATYGAEKLKDLSVEDLETQIEGYSNLLKATEAA